MSVEVFDVVQLPEEWTELDCSGRQGDSSSGVFIEVDLDQAASEDGVLLVVYEYSEELESVRIPPGSYDNEGRSFEYVIVDPRGSGSRVYEYGLDIAAVVDGEPISFAFGSPEEPLRWAPWESVCPTHRCVWLPEMNRWEADPSEPC